MSLSYFSENDFRRAQPACSLNDMKPIFLDRLDCARAYYGKPIIINSAYRSYDYELQQGRFGGSSHCKGLAVDIRCCDSNSRLRLVQSLLRAGFRRIGIYPTYIHVDCDDSKADALWL